MRDIRQLLDYIDESFSRGCSVNRETSRGGQSYSIEDLHVCIYWDNTEVIYLGESVDLSIPEVYKLKYALYTYKGYQDLLYLIEQYEEPET